SLEKCTSSRGRTDHHSETADLHAAEPTTAQKMHHPARRNDPPCRKCEFPRAVTVHRSGNAESHAQDWSTAQKLHFPARWNSPPFFTSAFKVICEAGK